MKVVDELSKRKLLDEMLAQTVHAKKPTLKQQRIVEVAIKMFAEKGYANTSTAEIAKAAEVAEGTIFKHFGTKDNLLLSIIIPYLKDFFPSIADETFSEVMSENVTTFEQFFKALLKNRIEFIAENREIFQVVIKEIFYREELKNELLPYFGETIITRINNVINLFKQRGEIIDIPNERIIKMLFTFVGGFFVSRFVLLNNYKVSDEEIEDATRLVMEGIRKNASKRDDPAN